MREICDEKRRVGKMEECEIVVYHIAEIVISSFANQLRKPRKRLLISDAIWKRQKIVMRQVMQQV